MDALLKVSFFDCSYNMDTVKNSGRNVKNSVARLKMPMSHTNYLTKNVLEWLKGIILLEYCKGHVT